MRGQRTKGWIRGIYALVCTVCGGAMLSPVEAQPVTSCAGSPYQHTYTSDADFDFNDSTNKSTLDNVNHNSPNNNQLQLNGPTETTTLPYIWVACSTRGTIVKILTETVGAINEGTVLGEYLSAPKGRGRDPSRTSVDLNGAVWCGNRAENGLDGWGGSAVKIALQEMNDCVDRNSSSFGIYTSIGLGDVKPWNNFAGADDHGGVSTAEDECIVDYVRGGSAQTRHISVDANNNVWIGSRDGHGFTRYPIEPGGFSFDATCGGYGGLVDGNNILWSAEIGGGVTPQLLRYDIDNQVDYCYTKYNFYGLGIDTKGCIWSTLYESPGRIMKLFPHDFHINDALVVLTGGNSPKGVAVTPADNNVWIANNGSHTVSRLNNNGGLVGTIDLMMLAGDGKFPTGVAVDAAGQVWVTCFGSDTVKRIAPTTNGGQVNLTVDLFDPTSTINKSCGPYNYSDMTGLTLRNATSRGTWTVTHDSGHRPMSWTAINWNSGPTVNNAPYFPPGTSFNIQARAGDDEEHLGAWVGQEVESNGSIDFESPLLGRFIEVNVTFQGITAKLEFATPVLTDLTVMGSSPKLVKIPTVSGWGLIVLGLLLVTGLTIKFGRRGAEMAVG